MGSWGLDKEKEKEYAHEHIMNIKEEEQFLLPHFYSNTKMLFAIYVQMQGANNLVLNGEKFKFFFVEF